MTDSMTSKPRVAPRHALWDHLQEQHALALLESELDEIIRLAVAAHEHEEGDHLERFTAYVVKEMPPGTIIGDPRWWARRLLAAAVVTAPELPADEPSASPVAYVLRRNDGLRIGYFDPENIGQPQDGYTFVPLYERASEPPSAAPIAWRRPSVVGGYVYYEGPDRSSLVGDRWEPLYARPAEPPAVGPLKLDNDRQVFFYEQDHYYLSNFSAFFVEIDGFMYPTSEHAYHCYKFPDRLKQAAIRRASSAHEAFKMAERWKPYRIPDWDNVKADVMRRILRAKVEQHEYVRRKLLETGDRELIENSWRDDVWGWGPNRDGQNLLGKLWMEIRAELRGASVTKSAPSDPLADVRWICSSCNTSNGHDRSTCIACGSADETSASRCIKCGSSPLATERGRCEDCGARQSTESEG